MSEKVTFQELIDSIADQSGNSKKFTREFLKNLVSVINTGLEDDGKVNIAGFGKFELRRMDEREGYNPQSEEKITIPAHNKVVFKPYKDLREQVNAPYSHLEPEFIDEVSEVQGGQAKVDAEKPDTPSSRSDRDTAADEDQEGEFIPTAPPSSISSEEDEAGVESGQEPTISTEDSRETDTGADSMEERRDEPETIGPETAYGEPEFYDSLSEDTPRTDSYSSPSSAQKSSGSRWIWIAAAIIALLVIVLGVWFLMPESGNERQEPAMAAQEQTPEEPAAELSGQEESETGAGSGAVSDSGDGSGEEIDDQPAVQNTPLPNDPKRLSIDRGQTLWSIAQKNYQDPYLWPWIYDANKSSIRNPDLIITGQTLLIPVPDNGDYGLSATDSLEVAIGYVATYRWYKDHGRERAKYYLWAARIYDGEVFDHISAPIDEDDLAFANRVR